MNTLALQGYMRQALGNWPPLQALIGQRIYDQPPPGPVLPYVTIGVVQALDESTTDCVTDWEVTAQVHVWSREVGYPQTKAIAQACDDALAERRPDMLGMRVGWFALSGHAFLRDPDGVTSHGVLEYRARYGPA